MTLFEVIRKALLAGLGVQESVKDMVDELVKKGELSETQGAQLVREWTDKAGKTGESLGSYISELIGKAQDKLDMPTRDEYDKLAQKVQSLSARVKKLEHPPD